MEINRYKKLNTYLKNIFGERILKICIDGGFTCPNRDGVKGKDGCAFCGAMGAGENIKGRCVDTIESIKSQVSTFLNSYRGNRASGFIVFFQSFSGTYDSLDNLKLKYDSAIFASEKIVGLSVATRPDLINKDIVNLLKSYTCKYRVSVELGFQTSRDKIRNNLNCHYSTRNFENACKLLREAGIDVVAHIMVGLPGETREDILQTINTINLANCNGVKIHSTYVQSGTKLEKMYLAGQYKTISQEYYIENVGYILEHLHPGIVVHRITADPPKEMLVAPEWTSHKKLVLNAINKYLNEKNILQGQKYFGTEKF